MTHVARLFIEDEKVETAVRMLQRKFSIEDVVAISQLSESKVRELQSEIDK